MYHIIGLSLAIFSGGSLLAFAVYAAMQCQGRKKPLYKKSLPPAAYPQEFLESARRAYGATGDIRGMLLLLQEKWPGGAPGKRIRAALDYLENSRYRDYETALFSCLSDGSKGCNECMEGIISQEIRKQRGLSCKGGQ